MAYALRCIEEAHCQLMRILAKQGMPEQAQNQFDQMQRILAEELGADPSPESEELLEQIQAGAFSERGNLPAISQNPSASGVGATASSEQTAESLPQSTYEPDVYYSG